MHSWQLWKNYNILCLFVCYQEAIAKFPSQKRGSGRACEHFWRERQFFSFWVCLMPWRTLKNLIVPMDAEAPAELWCQESISTLSRNFQSRSGRLAQILLRLQRMNIVSPVWRTSTNKVNVKYKWKLAGSWKKSHSSLTKFAFARMYIQGKIVFPGLCS